MTRKHEDNPALEPYEDLEVPGMANENFMRSGSQPGVVPGAYPEIDMSEELPDSLKPRHKRPTDLDQLLRSP